MDDSIKLIIHKGSTIFDSIIITYYSVIKYEQKARETKSIYQTNINMNNVNESNVVQVNRNSLNRKGFNAYIISAYITTLINSQTYRKAALKKLLQYLAYKLLNKVDSKIILIKLRMPRKQFLDYKW